MSKPANIVGGGTSAHRLWTRLPRRARAAIALVLVAAVAAAVGLAAGGSDDSGARSAVGRGAPAPDFSLRAARGGTYRLVRGAGKAIVLSFVDTSTGATAATDASRSQIVFLKSMEMQYRSRGLRVLVVAATRAPTKVSPDELLNFTYDWQLSRIPVLADPKDAVARMYGVTELPATFLIRSNRTVAARWDGFVSAQELAAAIGDVLGPNADR